jgi:hypothetical protein
MAKIVKYEFTANGWTQKQVKVCKDLRSAREESDKLNKDHDDPNQVFDKSPIYVPVP